MTFWFNAAVIILGLFQGALYVYIASRMILDPLSPVYTTIFVIENFLTVSTPLIVDSVLILRLYAVYHPRTTSTSTVMAVFTFPILVKVGRAVAISIFLSRLVNFAKTTDNMCLAMAVFFPRDKFIVTEWILQAADNIYLSTLFIYRLRGQTSLFTGTTFRTRRLMARLFFIATGNFVFPVMLNIVQIIYMFVDGQFLHGSVILLINVYVSIIGVVFATVWVTGDAYMASNHVESAGQGTGFTGAFSAAPGRDPLTTYSTTAARRSSKRSSKYGYTGGGVHVYVEKERYGGASSTSGSDSFLETDELDQPQTPLTAKLPNVVRGVVPSYPTAGGVRSLP